ncbi:MAG TPA: transposase [Lacipirellulaceae bacterium]|nr:transposase [Lacipirellulaceae bacterium]
MITGRLLENCFIESFNGRLRDECLNVYDFASIDHAQRLIESWGEDYNQFRPHGALGHLTPSEYAKRGQEYASEVAELQLRAM